jgi:hypothetical protein
MVTKVLNSLILLAVLFTGTAARLDYRVVGHNSRGATTHMYGRLLYDNKKVKQSRYRPGLALRVPGN